ncbi:MAG: acyltransferase [Burkholderiales bacterium]|nr:acyltransferase [Burkholderiales bacterium]
MLTFTPSLHGLRGIAALAVLAFHWSEYFPALPTALRRVPFAGTTWDLAMQLGFGWLGVYLFFVLSGYLLASQLATQSLSGPSVLQFWRRRFLRIFPGVWFQVAILVVLSWLGIALIAPFTGTQVLMNLMLWINMPPWMQPPLNGVYWTLPIEFSFYLALPFIVAIQRRVGWRTTFVIALLIALAWRAGVMAAYRGDHMVSRLPILDALPGSLASFMAGVAISNVEWSPTPARRRAFIALIAAALLAMEYWLLANRDTYWTGHWMLAIWNPVVSVIIGLGVLALLRPPPELAFLGRRELVWLGEVSYGIYLWHLPAIYLVRMVGGESLNSPAGSGIALVATVAITLVMAALSFHLVERPMMRLGKRAREA